MNIHRPNYFTCTLAEALKWNTAQEKVKTRQTDQGVICQHKEFQNITEFVDFLAKNYGQNLAIGCITPKKTSTYEVIESIEEHLSFECLREQSCRLSRYFTAQFGRGKFNDQCVALMASSSVIYAIVWLALIRAGYRVMLLAPQNTADATRHLLKISKAFAICYDQDCESRVLETLVQNNLLEIGNKNQNSLAAADSLQQFKIPWLSLRLLIDSYFESNEVDSTELEIPGPDSIAFYHHSSGTTKLPKLIPQTHNGQVGILPQIQGHGESCILESTFTTTPLCTGGIADLMRSWSAASPLWLFPEGKLPITGQTVLSCFRSIDNISSSSMLYPTSRLAYLSCVPFVLESLVENKELKDRIRDLNAVGVGGAAMPSKLGNELVDNGIPLVSRFGSSECGFLLSSERDYRNDLSWQALRASFSAGLNFQPISDDRYELIVDKDWPLVSTAEHAQRPFNTHDFFSPHESIANAWQYGGRSDLQLTLCTGKKLDPVLIEDEIRRHELIEDAVLIGNDRPYPAVIIFTVSKSFLRNEEERNQEIWLHIQKVNEKIPSHARILRRSFKILDSSQIIRIPKNSKGGVSRIAFLKNFEIEINEIYHSEQLTTGGDFDSLQSSKEIYETVQATVKSILNSSTDLEPNEDLFDAGVDSTRSIQIRTSMCDLIPSRLRSGVPQNVVFECGTIDDLAKFFINLLNSNCEKQSNLRDLKEAKYTEMRDMVEMNLNFQPKLLQETMQQSGYAPRTRPRNKNVIILTGVTGFLGIHIFENLIRDPNTEKIYLFVRGSPTSSFEEQCVRAKARVHSTLEFYEISAAEELFHKFQCVPFLLKDVCMGIPSPLYNKITSEITHVVHAAWEVNFNLPLRSFSSQILGTVNLFNLMLLSGRSTVTEIQNPSFIFCSSVASVANKQAEDSSSFEPANAVDIGYAQSKWVTEAILIGLNEKYPEINVTILRLGQLSGCTRTGIWNPREAWPLMINAGLTSLLENGKVITLPDLASLKMSDIDWFPVDHAAASVCKEMLARRCKNFKIRQVSNKNPQTHISWSQFQLWLREWAKANKLEINFVEPKSWINQLERKNHQAKVLVSLWRDNWRIDKFHKNSLAVPDEVGDILLSKSYIWHLLDSMFQRRNLEYRISKI
ncbi:Adenylate-forming reductase Nps10 [Golovinomyces cichoracearum]|uniref:Adenylate-forming reductase Nps10 n=1 Tax=Golovinomyces cichoracearum TaxID=62708 RepID=A0A420H824_9PEZI|nr:Adenylate-forming reductase Nps10 [Golovinomyces cichoracearum]